MNAVDTQLDLARLGDQLEAAADRSLRTARGQRVGRAGLGVVALTLVAAGTALATGLFTPRQVAIGMPDGTLIFGGTHPACTLDRDQSTYHCTLAIAPTDTLDYRGSKQLIVIDRIIAGGCIGQDAAGLAWDCWVGKAAVDHEILTHDFLGEPALGPGQG
jgi:hypothetical protein